MGIGDEIRAQRHGVNLKARRLFTNRDRELALFRDKLQELSWQRHQPPTATDPTDLRAPRRNVLVFYGHGGIGKTRLSQAIEQDFLATAGSDAARVAVRIDLSEPSARDAELFLFALRAGLARTAPAFPAFDTALTLYWSRQHPGTSIPEFVRHQSALGGLADRATLADHLTEFTAALVDRAGPGAQAARRLVGVAWDTIREARTVRRLRRDCPYFEDCSTESDLEEMRLHLPLLLAWDLAQLPEPPQVAVFIDTFEHIASGDRRPRKGGLEDTIARSAFFLRSTCFVVTSRARLTWGSEPEPAHLEMAGPTTWPGLASSNDADQHTVGVFTIADSEHHLAAAVLDTDNQPGIPPHLRAHIAELSDGIPLYLNIATNHFLALSGKGATPTTDDFTAGVPELVTRMMEDLDDNETDLLRVAALLGVFDTDTLKAAVPDIRWSAVERFVRRTFILERGDGIFSIHELLRTSVRSEDAHTSNPWSPSEWREAEDRLITHWATAFTARDDALWRDRRQQALAFWQLCGLYATTGAEADVLADVIMLVQMQGAWATLEAGQDQPRSLLNERGRGLIRVLDGVLARQVSGLDHADRLLTESLGSPGLTGNLARLATYYLAETRDLQGASPTSLFEQLAQGDDRIGTEARLAHAHALVRDGDLTAALTIADGLSLDAGDLEFSYRRHELLGVVWLSAGEFDLAVEHFEASRKVGAARGSALLVALGLRHLCLTLCWLRPADALAYLDEAETLNRDLALPPGIGQCLMARAVASIGIQPQERVAALVAESEACFSGAGYPDDAVAPLAVNVLAAAAGGDQDLAHEHWRVLMERSQGRRARTWPAAADVWTGHREKFDTVSWPRGADRAHSQWTEALMCRMGQKADGQPTPPPV